jgi:hypothetical protein
MHPNLILLFSRLSEPCSASETKERALAKRADTRTARALYESVRADERALHESIRATSANGGTSVIFDKHAGYLEKVGCGAWLYDSLHRRHARSDHDSDDCRILLQRYRHATIEVFERARLLGFSVERLTSDANRVSWA